MKDDTANEDMGIASDPVAGQIATVPKDFQIFINLVGLTK